MLVPALLDTRAMRITNAGLSMAAMLALAGCGTGQQLAAGPVVGYVAGRGWSAGWEAGGGPMTTYTSAAPTVGSLVSRFAVGMSWRPAAPGSEARERITYAAWEPWLGLGGSLGVAHSSTEGSVRPLIGLWEAAPYVVGAGKRSLPPLYRCSPCYTASLAIGWRWGGAGELYLAPKVGILNDTLMPFPFQTEAD